MHEINTEDVYDDFSSNDEMFDILTKSKPHNDSNKLVIGKKKDQNCWYWNYRICCIETKKCIQFWQTIMNIKKQEV